MVRSKDYLFISYSDGINGGAKQYNLHSGNLASIKLPLEGCGLGGNVLVSYGIKCNDGFIQLTSWKQPRTIYDYNADNQQTALSAFDVKANYPGMDDVKVVETEVPGHDGAMIPLSIVYNKNVKLDGSTNCLLTGYGAYGISLTPSFSTMLLALINKGVIYAVAHVRGGGEKGEAWYKAGYKTTKPNTWKDLISCAEYLIKNKYTSAAKITGMGTSAGGITIGRAVTTRPDLFGAAIDNVGCSNALRLENGPNGPINIPEFGTVKDSVESRALFEMDALHHVKEGVKYPAVMCVCGWHDPRVIAWQPAKFAAALQYASVSGKPVLLDVNYDDGHFTEDKAVTFKNFANMFAFGLWQTGNPGFQLND
jgi:prolyl oligopeptidase